MSHWCARPGGQGELAGEGMTHLGRATLRHGSPQHQSTLIHVATNSIEFLWLEEPDGRSALHRLRCNSCSCHLTLSHLVECQAPDAVGARDCSQRGSTPRRAQLMQGALHIRLGEFASALILRRLSSALDHGVTGGWSGLGGRRWEASWENGAQKGNNR